MPSSMEPQAGGSTRADWAARVRLEAVSQWDRDPAGARDAGGAPLDTLEASRAVELARYKEQPWMHDTLRFDRFRDARVLEVGVGLGTDHLQFARAGARVTGIDLSPRSLAVARRRLELEGLESDLHLMDAESLGFDDDAFDCVYSFGVLHHVPAPERAFGEIRRVLRPGGAFIGGLYSRRSAVAARYALGWTLGLGFLRESFGERLSRVVEFSSGDARPLVRLFGARELRAVLHEAGFENVALKRRHAGLGRHVARVPRGVEAVVGRTVGWYLVHEAR
jgi:SAM-dependent methyltransferase